MPPLNRPGYGIPADIAGFAQAYPELSEALAHPLDRRRILKLLAAAFGTAGLAGCSPGAADRRLVSAVIAPPGIIPGRPDHYATANVVDGYATGIVVTHLMGRPTKVEGNPLHPASLGATDVFGQAGVLDFYDPDRNQAPSQAGVQVDWQQVDALFADLRARLAASHGAGFRLLTGTTTSPTTGAAIDTLLARYPEAQWHQWDPVSRDSIRNGARLAYGKPVVSLPRLENADAILAIDSDLLSSTPGTLAFARAFAQRRNPVRASMNRLYAIEPTPSLTGVAADHRFIASPQDIDTIVAILAAALLHGETPSGGPAWLAPLIADLRTHHGRALIHAGPDQPAETHALIHAMNEALGGRAPPSIWWTRPSMRPPIRPLR